MTQRDIDLMIADENLKQANKHLARCAADPWVGHLRQAHGQLLSSVRAIVRADAKG